MGMKEYMAYSKLSKNGKAVYGRERAAEAEANRGTFNETLAKLYSGYYSQM
jgi:hypothetical protein